jgi:beta-aspartyl-peptidase (threonine type)
MRAILPALVLCLMTTLAHAADPPPIRLLIHGGAGTIERGKLTPALEAEYTAALAASLAAGYELLAQGGSSVDAVVAAIVVMEESPLFNAGKGAVFDHEGKNELDASIMDGATRGAGAVAGVGTVRNPIRAAAAVMRHGQHVMLAGAGAESFAREQGLEIVDPSWFRTEERWRQLQKAIAEERILRDHDAGPAGAYRKDDKRGTVGAVALDRHGKLAAGTSTGGLTNKRYGRIGDSPVIGAGTWADDRSVAVSATGTGEMFIRSAAAHSVADRVRFAGSTLTEAADAILAEVAAIGGDGGLIVLDAKGGYAMRFNTSGMYRGTVGGDGIAELGIYGDAELRRVPLRQPAASRPAESAE